ncbi:MAG: DNA-processing protein DprA, partial [Bacteroidia bacterium]|nr:DNA-processing protein DprA [Bacteroidia bacterium]
MSLTAEERLYWIALHQIKGIGGVIARNLMSYCQSAQAVFSKPKSVLLSVPGVGEKAANAILSQSEYAIQRAKQEIVYCQQQNIHIISFLDEDYPELLKKTNPFPNLLFYKGHPVWNQKPTIAIVGTRKPTSYGIQQARRFATELASAGFHIISGLAYGIDAEAHTAAFYQPGLTTAVLGSGLGKVYPAKHYLLSEKIIEYGGAVITEFLHDETPEATNFPARNRIIAGMCLATVVIEAASKGGALITAKMAFEENREVYAVPGNLTSPNSDGCNQLIRDNIA